MDELMWLLVTMMFMPFAFIGVYYLMDILVRKVKEKTGHYEISYITKNFRIKRIMAKPNGDKIKYDGKTEMPFNNKPPYISFRGTTPIAMYDSNGIQLPLMSDTDEGSQIDPGYFSNMLKEAYHLGAVSSFAKQNPWMLILIIGCLAAAAASAVLGFLIFQKVVLVTA